MTECTTWQQLALALIPALIGLVCMDLFFALIKRRPND
jgi:hypothetical protein